METTTERLYQIFKIHPQISINSRNISDGCIFFALKGENFNGNLFAPEALEKGAAYCVVDEPPEKPDERFLIVKNVLETLQQLAIHHRRKIKIPVIGITGSNGKTTTKELTGAVLSQKFNTFITQGNLNNHIGVPLSILSIRNKTEIAVIEMGANHQGEIAALCEIARPDFGIITNIGKAHLEGFGGYQGVIKAKTELYHFIARTGGKLFVNQDDPLLMEKSSGIERVTYGGDADATISGSVTMKYPALAIQIMIEGRKLKVASNLAGSYNFYNMLVAATLGNYFGVDIGKIVAGLESYTPANNRSQWMDTGKNKIIMDAYNANPSSMMAALDDFAQSPYPNKVVILGDMLELGEEAPAEHLNIFHTMQTFPFQTVILVGKNFCNIAKGQNVPAFNHVEEAKKYLESFGLSECTILIKGSRGIALEKLLEVV